jgi:hypothetical protein
MPLRAAGHGADYARRHFFFLNAALKASIKSALNYIARFETDQSRQRKADIDLGFGIAKPKRSTMSANVGRLDRVARFFAGIILIYIASCQPVTGVNWFDRNEWIGWIGIIPILTAFVGWCPLYSILGISTKTAEA